MSSGALSHIDGAAVSELPKGWKHLVEVVDGWIETGHPHSAPSFSYGAIFHQTAYRT